mgnify:CR=1 FL=1
MSFEVYTSDFQNGYLDIMMKCWEDEAFKKRFLQDPVTVFAEHGVNVPEGGRVVVTEVDEPTTIAIALPPKPEAFAELSDEDLDSVAGGIRDLNVKGNVGDVVSGNTVTEGRTLVAGNQDNSQDNRTSVDTEVHTRWGGWW